VKGFIAIDPLKSFNLVQVFIYKRFNVNLLIFRSLIVTSQKVTYVRSAPYVNCHLYWKLHWLLEYAFTNRACFPVEEDGNPGYISY